MKLPRRGFLRLSAGAAALPVASRIAQAGTYPSRPITLVVGASAGGPTDTIGRIITERMRMSLGTTIVIENNGSAAGSIAHGRVARAAADGYTLSLGHWGTHVVNGAVYALTYDVFKDFEPVALISSNPYLMVGRLTLPVDDLAARGSRPIPARRPRGRPVPAAPDTSAGSCSSRSSVRRGSSSPTAARTR
jgi:tripartite-type tricarboxylate transporter receptor subunit TctC